MEWDPFNWYVYISLTWSLLFKICDVGPFYLILFFNIYLFRNCAAVLRFGIICHEYSFIKARIGEMSHLTRAEGVSMSSWAQMLRLRHIWNCPVGCDEFKCQSLQKKNPKMFYAWRELKILSFISFQKSRSFIYECTIFITMHGFAFSYISRSHVTVAFL